MSITFQPSNQEPTVVHTSRDKPGLRNVVASLREYRTGNDGDKPLKEVIQCSEDANKPSARRERNGFVDSVVDAYCYHHNIVLRTDDFWTAIMTQFSLYVNNNAESLRDKFVSHTGKKNLIIEASGTLRTANYAQFAERMAAEIQKNLKDDQIRSWVIQDFTTTTASDKVVSSVLLMASMQQYFSYGCRLCCGIPNVTLLGTPEDYIKLRKKIDKLLEFEVEGKAIMKKWHQHLSPILDELVLTSSGKPNLDFWGKICDRHSGGSGPSYLSGWITAFCAFDQHGVWRGDTCSAKRLGITSPWPVFDLKKIQPGYCTVPVEVDDNGTKYDTVMFAGSFAVDVIDDGLTIKPRCDWALALKKLKK